MQLSRFIRIEMNAQHLVSAEVRQGFMFRNTSSIPDIIHSLVVYQQYYEFAIYTAILINLSSKQSVSNRLPLNL